MHYMYLNLSDIIIYTLVSYQRYDVWLFEVGIRGHRGPLQLIGLVNTKWLIHMNYQINFKILT